MINVSKNMSWLGLSPGQNQWITNLLPILTNCARSFIHVDVQMPFKTLYCCYCGFVVTYTCLAKEHNFPEDMSFHSYKVTVFQACVPFLSLIPDTFPNFGERKGCGVNTCCPYEHICWLPCDLLARSAGAWRKALYKVTASFYWD